MPSRLTAKLEPGVIHVWTVRLDASGETLKSLQAELSAAQLERAARFRFEHLRRNYTLEQGLLRRILGAYLARPASEIEFRTGERGKPYLAGAASNVLQFNVSHSGGLVTCAVTTECEIGVDIEVRRDMDDIEAIARNYFAAGEMSDLMGLPESERKMAFFRCWTRKEAFLKATGEGLYFPLGRFRVSLKPGMEPALIEIDGQPPSEPWHMREFTPTSDHSGAIAWTGKPLTVVHELFANAEDCSQRLVGRL